MKRFLPMAVFAVIGMLAGDLFAQVAHGPEVVGPNTWDIIQTHISGGSLAIVGTLITLYIHARRVFSPIVKSITTRLDEHDIMWEEYNIRNGGSWRIERGRAGIRTLHAAEKERLAK